MSVIPDSHRDIVDKPSFWHIATIGPNGEPQSSPVWLGIGEDGLLRFSNVKGRQKYKNLLVNTDIALSAIDPDNAYRYLEVRGTVVQIDDDPQGEFIDEMALKYLGVDTYPGHDPDVTPKRVVVVIEPHHCTTMGGAPAD